MKTTISLINAKDKEILKLQKTLVGCVSSLEIYGEDNAVIDTNDIVHHLSCINDKELSEKAVQLKKRIMEDLQAFNDEIQEVNNRNYAHNEKIESQIKEVKSAFDDSVRDLPETKMTASLCVNIKRMNKESIETLFEVYKKFGFEHVTITEKEHFIHYNPAVQPKDLFPLFVEQTLALAKKPFAIDKALSKGKPVSFDTVVKSKLK